MVHAEDFRDAVVEIWVLWRQKNIFQLLNIRVVQLANHRDPSRREATRAQLTWPITEILLEERLLRTVGLISPDDQLCCTQASQGDCVAGEGYHPADVSCFCLVRLSFMIVVCLSGLRPSLVWGLGVRSHHFVVPHIQLWVESTSGATVPQVLRVRYYSSWIYCCAPLYRYTWHQVDYIFSPARSHTTFSRSIHNYSNFTVDMTSPALWLWLQYVWCIDMIPELRRPYDRYFTKSS